VPYGKIISKFCTIPSVISSPYSSFVETRADSLETCSKCSVPIIVVVEAGFLMKEYDLKEV
jgi:hypothetical protein